MTEQEEKKYITLWLYNNTKALCWADVESAEDGDFSYVVDAVYDYAHREEKQ
jgi:hypothetical protein